MNKGKAQSQSTVRVQAEIVASVSPFYLCSVYNVLRIMVRLARIIFELGSFRTYTEYIVCVRGRRRVSLAPWLPPYLDTRYLNGDCVHQSTVCL